MFARVGASTALADCEGGVTSVVRHWRAHPRGRRSRPPWSAPPAGPGPAALRSATASTALRLTVPSRGPAERGGDKQDNSDSAALTRHSWAQ